MVINATNRRPQAHDLLWLKPGTTVLGGADLPDWVTECDALSAPLVVRRDKFDPYAIPVGIRGRERHQRHAAWVSITHVEKCLTPQHIARQANAPAHLDKWAAIPAYQALLSLLKLACPGEVGVTGSLGFSLACGRPAVTVHSDLDLSIPCPLPVSREDFAPLLTYCRQLPVRVDIQIETPYGGFALAEWLQQTVSLLKTNDGPRLTRDPWQRPEVLPA